MLLETPFHPSTAALCRNRRWRDWSGYTAALSCEPGHEYEYYAVCSGSALSDITPLRKYEIHRSRRGGAGRPHRHARRLP